MFGIDKIEQVNVGLPDYKYMLNITIDTFIEDDPQGDVFNDTLSVVQEKINKFINGDVSLSVAFEEIPVVGWINSDIDLSITSDSNRAVLTSEIIASF